MTSASRLASEPVAAAEPDWTWKRFEQLSNDDVYDVLVLRSEIFVVEQRCVFLDPDGLDRSAWHLLGRLQGGAPLAAYLRCLDPAACREPSIGRVVVASPSRGLGIGRALMDEGIVRSRTAWPGRDIMINAQRRLETFYRSLGFETEGMPYIEDGIEHVAMRRLA